MKILLVKMSSMGDVIHLLPAITDATSAIPGLEIHWVIEEGFQEIPHWMPGVTRVIPIALRRWRKQGWRRSWPEIKTFIANLRANTYDVVIDAQGLVKSSLITRLAKGKRLGLNYRSARESLAALFYNKKFNVVFEQHAIIRGRQLLSQALGYTLPPTEAYSAMHLPAAINLPVIPEKNTILFFHGTTWVTKHWPEAYWLQLAALLQERGLTVLLPWSSQDEYARAERIAAVTGAQVLPRLNLTQIAGLLLKVSACVAVDTGLGHLAAVMGIPTISLYGPTDPKMTGTLGRNQYHLTSSFACAPCFQDQCKLKQSDFKETPPCFSSISPEQVMKELLDMMQGKQ